VTRSSRGHAILGHAPRDPLAEERFVMSMPNTARAWTLAELHRLPEDGNKYELVYGELFVTPAPTEEHETIAARLTRMIDPYVAKHRLGLVYRPRAVVQRRKSEVEPDLMVRTERIRRKGSWRGAPVPLLVVEIVSPTTRRRDHIKKRTYYEDIGVAEYWIVDASERSVRVVRPNVEDTVVTATLSWMPAGVPRPLAISLARLFAGIKPGEE
jgi:Uma2 family endonuclease